MRLLFNLFNRYTLVDTDSTVDMLHQDSESGLVCTIKAKGAPRSDFRCRTLAMTEVNTRGQELMSNLVKVDFLSAEKQPVVRKIDLILFYRKCFQL